jgi:predicted ATPase/class 3 adenylate cyclase
VPTRPTGTVTFLFTDPDRDEAGDTDYAAAEKNLARHDAILRQAIEAHGGYAYKIIRHTFQAAFSTASKAVLAAHDAQRALLAEDWGPYPVHVRMALHTGVTEERGDDYYGPILNRVARVMSSGHGGQILLTQATQELLTDAPPPGVGLRHLGEHRLRDLIRPEHIYQLTSPDLPSEFPPLRTLTGKANNLPPQPTLIIGREKEVDACIEMLQRDDVWLVTLTGPGGIGKTRLALQVAAEMLDVFEHGTFFVPLAPITDPSLVASTIAQALDVREVGGQPVLEGLKEYLSDKEVLLVLDNFEQVVGAAALISDLLESAPRLKVLATSRAPLRISSEREMPVPPLRLPDHAHPPAPEQLSQYEAVALFIARAVSVKPDFAINNENAPAVAEICYRLDGLPLAIELAAARVKMLSPAMLLARLDSRLKLLTGGARDLPARQQTLRGTIDWSYGLLEEAEKMLFARLAVFVGGCTLEAAEAVCCDFGVSILDFGLEGDPKSVELLPLGGEVIDLLESLVNKSLVAQIEDEEADLRFTMLETIREYATECMLASGEEGALRRRHAECFLQVAEQALPKLRGPEQTEWMRRLEREHDNFRAALEWTRQTTDDPSNPKSKIQNPKSEVGLRMATALWPFWWRRGYLTEGRGRVMAALALIDTEPTLLRSNALYAAGYMACLQRDFEAGRPLLDESLSIRRQLGEKKLIAVSLTGLAQASRLQGDYAEARRLQEESLQIAQELRDPASSASAFNNLGLDHTGLGDYEAARASLEQSLAISRRSGDDWGAATALNNLSLVARARQDYEIAETHAAESLRLRRALGDKFGIAFSLSGLAASASALGEWERAAFLLGATRTLGESLDAYLEPLYYNEYNRCFAATRHELGEATFQAAFERGRHMPLDEALTIALREGAPQATDSAQQTQGFLLGSQ